MAETKAKLTQYLQEITKQRGSFSSEAIVEPNPSNPSTATIVIDDPLRAEVLVSCRIVPDNQYILAKLADFNWVGNGYSSIKYPKLGEQVIVLFLRGDINSGVIIGRMPSIEEPVHLDTGILNTIRKDEFGNEEVWDILGIKVTDFSGNQIETSVLGITVTCPAGVTITITPAGIVSVTASTEVDITSPLTLVTGDLEVTGTILAAGSITTSGGNCIIEAGNINILAGNITLDTGNVTAVAGNIAATVGDVTAGAISLKSHTHLYNPGPGIPTQTAIPTV